MACASITLALWAWMALPVPTGFPGSPVQKASPGRKPSTSFLEGHGWDPRPTAGLGADFHLLSEQHCQVRGWKQGDIRPSIKMEMVPTVSQAVLQALREE